MHIFAQLCNSRYTRNAQYRIILQDMANHYNFFENK